MMRQCNMYTCVCVRPVFLSFQQTLCPSHTLDEATGVLLLLVCVACFTPVMRPVSVFPALTCLV